MATKVVGIEMDYRDGYQGTRRTIEMATKVDIELDY